MSKGLALVVALSALALTGTAVAGNGKGPTKSSSSLSLVIVSSAGLAPASTVGAHYGDTVTFDVSTTATDTPLVQLSCYQNGAMVYSSSANFAVEPDHGFLLSSNAWTGGAANCTATLFYWDGHKFSDLTSIGVAVAA